MRDCACASWPGRGCDTASALPSARAPRSSTRRCASLPPAPRAAARRQAARRRSPRAGSTSARSCSDSGSRLITTKRGQTATDDERSSKPGGPGSIDTPSTPPPSKLISSAAPSASSETAAEQPRARRGSSLLTVEMQACGEGSSTQTGDCEPPRVAPPKRPMRWCEQRLFTPLACEHLLPNGQCDLEPPPGTARAPPPPSKPRIAGARMAAARPPTCGWWPYGRTCSTSRSLASTSSSSGTCSQLEP